MNEQEIGELLEAVPAGRRMQVRAAVAGTAADLIKQVRAVRGAPDSGWQGALSALFLAEVAARYRPPEQVAQLAIELLSDCGSDAILAAAALARPTLELAAIAVELDLLLGPTITDQRGPAVHEPGMAEQFLACVAAQRLPGDLAGMLSALPREGRVAQALIALISVMAPDRITHVILHLRGTGIPEFADEIAGRVVRHESDVRLAAFLTALERCDDRETLQRAIDIATTWADPPASAEAAQQAVPWGADRITDLVTALLKARRPELAKLVVTSAVRNFAPYGQQYRLCALLFVFKQHELGDEAEQIRNEILADLVQDDEVEMIISICEQNTDRPQDIVNLLSAILENPKPGVTPPAAVRLAKNLTSARPDIFATVSSWSYQNLIEFEELLRRSSGGWAGEFRENVADRAWQRNNADDIGEIVLWLLRDIRGDHGKTHARQRASRLVAGTVGRREPEEMVTLISKLRDYQVLPGDQHEGWWTVRDTAAGEIAAQYDADHMTRLVTAGADLCLPALLRLAQEWLTHAGRTDAQVVSLVKALKGARGDQQELGQTLEYCGRVFYRADGTSPLRALRTAGLEDEANAWIRHKNPMNLRSVWARRPDPDPRRPGQYSKPS